MPEFCVYCHTSPSGKKYVGISKSPIRRWRNGRGYECNLIFYRAILKYGWDSFTHEILFCNITESEAIRLERELISKLKLTDKTHGYNLRDGANGSMSEESRKKMSASRIGNTNCVGRTLPADTKKKIANSLSSYYKTHDNPFKGKQHSEETVSMLRNRNISIETRRKMSLNHPNVSGENNPSARAIVQTTKDGEFVRRYPYAKAAAENLSIDLSSIIKCCRGKNKICGGFKWQYEK